MNNSTYWQHLLKNCAKAFVLTAPAGVFAGACLGVTVFHETSFNTVLSATYAAIGLTSVTLGWAATKMESRQASQ